MATSALEADALALGDLWKDTSASIYCEIASLTFVLFDHVVTIDQEVERIWKSPWSLPKVLFLFNRYTGPISLLVNTTIFTNSPAYSVCQKWIHFEGAAGIIAKAAAEMIMIFRLYALYRGSKIMLVLLVLGSICNLTTMSVLMQLGLERITIYERPGSWYKGCHPVGLPNWFWGYYISPLIFETILLLLTLYKTVGHIRSKVTHTPVIQLFVRDGVAYFAIMFCTLLSNALIWLLAPPGLLEAGIGFAIAVPTVMASRILLNLRGLSGTPESSELTAATREDPHYQGIQYQHGAPIGRARVLPTLTQWTVSGEETIIARMQEIRSEKHPSHEGTLPPKDISSHSSIEKGKGREMDIEMSPVSSAGKSPITPTLPHDTHFGRYDF
ncbi:unnamed protein product [Rhizoctonia solani]|uniref:DUF6533 domain-containing protein n=1 Tax=Rhizoctonia solani TaxID=456999 RepID=A0A8H3H2X1_9AGAM|nr:unnamed protein product [Rhizoctonia solani]CAE6515086.1 unnamed protein product [Rhizoctonia solani]